MKIHRTIVLTMLFYASVVSFPSSAKPNGKSAASPDTTAAPATSPRSSSPGPAGRSASSSNYTDPTPAPNSTSTGKPGKKTGTVTHVDIATAAINAIVAKLTQYAEKISSTVQAGFGGSRAAPKVNTKDGNESPWNYGNYGNWASTDDSTKPVAKKGTTKGSVGAPPKNVFNEALSALVTKISQVSGIANAYGGG